MEALRDITETLGFGYDFNFKYKLFCKGHGLRIFVIVPQRSLARKSMEQIKQETMEKISKGLNPQGYKINILGLLRIGKISLEKWLLYRPQRSTVHLGKLKRLIGPITPFYH